MLIRWVRNLCFVHVPRELSLSPSSSVTQPKIPLLFAVKQSTLVTILHHFWQHICLSFFSPPLTFFSYTIHCLHAAFNVVGDVTVEQPGTGILRTHFHCLEKISTSDSFTSTTLPKKQGFPQLEGQRFVLAIKKTAFKPLFSLMFWKGATPFIIKHQNVWEPSERNIIAAFLFEFWEQTGQTNRMLFLVPVIKAVKRRILKGKNKEYWLICKRPLSVRQQIGVHGKVHCQACHNSGCTVYWKLLPYLVDIKS